MRPIESWKWLAGTFVLVALAGAWEARAQDAPPAGDDLANLGLEELMSLQVTGVSRRAESLGTTPAAVFVLTGEDIRRSGARTIAEALRMVPGLDVARVNAESYAISARGFNSSSADKLEVIVDGRSVYTPLTSSVFWDVLDTYLPDIERIEVIRGPGGTVWGANAVNGVINIVTRSAADTQGEVLSGGGGNEEKAFGAFRAGGRFGDHGYVRAYAKSSERDSFQLRDGADAPDGQVLRQGGVRADWSSGAAQRVTVSGDVYDGHSDDASGQSKVNGGNVVAHWRYTDSRGDETSVQFFHDAYDRRIPSVYSEDRRTSDLDLQYSLAAIGAQAITLGAGFRTTSDDTGGPPLAVVFLPKDRTTRRYSAFVQDQIAFGGGRGSLSLGTKVEHNPFTGTELQPGARIGWQLHHDLFAWASVARAVRTPNRLDHDIAIFCAPEFAALLGCEAGTTLAIGSPDFDSEKLVAWESGLRLTPVPSVLIELAAYYDDYKDLRATEGIGTNIRFVNGFDGEGAGGELNATWRATDALRLAAFYSYLDLNLSRNSGVIDTTTQRQVEGSSPRHQAGVDANWQAAPSWQLGGQLRYVDRLKATDVPAYTELDLRVNWQALRSVSLTLVGQDLLDSSHPEFGPLPGRVEVRRGGYAELTWRWD